jgi:hypothetical protein
MKIHDRNEPWWRTLAKLVALGALLYLVISVALFVAAVVIKWVLFWIVGALMLFGAVMMARWAWDLRK